MWPGKAEDHVQALRPTKGEEDEGEDEEERCPACTTTQGDKRVWVACSHCGTWFHVVCVHVDRVDLYETWYCAPCLCDPALHLEIKMRAPPRRSGRMRPTTDYAAIEEGKPIDPLGRWARLLAMYDTMLDTVRRVDGATWTSDWLAWSPDALEAPVLVPADAGAIPGMRVPPRSTTIRDVAEKVGVSTNVEVIDVQTQMSSNAWTLDEWATYMETPAAERERLLNVISLEVTGTPFETYVQAPQMVRESDWVERDWPCTRRPLATDASKWPKVQRYVLMGVQGAFTDFHIDFAASYVYYHVVWGEKVFLFAPPTPANLAAYKAWSSSARQASEWLGYALHDMMRVTIRAGETMFIPAGWIHCVHTPQDTLVVGGNFLADYHVAMHWRLEEMEKATHVPRKFRFPHLVRLAWYVAYGWHTRHTQAPDMVLAPRVREGIAQLCKRLDVEVAWLAQPASTSKAAKAAHDAVPRDVVHDAPALVASLRAWVATMSAPALPSNKRRRRSSTTRTPALGHAPS